jgi:hypothetical protein
MRSFLAFVFSWLFGHRFEREEELLPLSFGFDAA